MWTGKFDLSPDTWAYDKIWTGLDWTNKTWINKLWIDETWINKTCIYDQIRKGLFFLGFIGIEYDKNDLGTDVPVQ